MSLLIGHRRLPPMNGIKAVGFDLDGTFMRTRVDYAKLNAADRDVCLSHGIPFDEIDFGDSPKRPRAPIRCECEFVSEAVPYPGSAECLPILKSRGLKVGILTRGSLEYATRALGPLFEEFDVVMGRDYSEYDNAKPSPKAMEEFAAELGVRPEEILYVGDNSTDWMSAHGAGASFVGVRTGSGSDEMWASVDPDIPVIDYAGDVVTLL